jgi:tetratricopeptide (TPR) repeat protein
MVKTFIKMLLTGLVLVMLVISQGCSSLSKTEKADEDLVVLGKDIVDLVDLPVSENKITGDMASIDSPKIKRNLYLEQAQQRLANVPVHVLTQYKQALTLMKKKQWKAAEQLFNQVLLSQPQLSGAYVNKALIAVHQKQLNLANEHLDKALVVNPVNPYAHQLKGRVARLNGQFAQAEISYLEALSIWPEYLEAQINLAILLELYRGRLLDARKYYTAYLVLQPEDAQVQRWLAGVEIKIKRAGLTLPEEIENDSLASPVTESTTSDPVNVSGES